VNFFCDGTGFEFWRVIFFPVPHKNPQVGQFRKLKETSVKKIFTPVMKMCFHGM